MLLAVLIAAFVVARSAHAAATLASSLLAPQTTAVFPPPGADITSDASFFPDATQVNIFGPTPTGDEAFAIETATRVARLRKRLPAHRAGNFGQQKVRCAPQLGNLSPFQSTNLGLKSSARVPAGCTLQQVHLLHRHGARYPTSGSPPASFAAALHAAASTGNLSASGPLAFLNTWTYKLGAEILTPFGRAELFELGVGFRVKYGISITSSLFYKQIHVAGDLLKGFTDLPVWRTTLAGAHFAAGFFGVQEYQKDYRQLIEIEAPGFNSTLAPYGQCPNANNAIRNLWHRHHCAMGVNLPRGRAEAARTIFEGTDAECVTFIGNAADVYKLKLFRPSPLGYSAFCDLFTEEEWKGYEYATDLSFWYNNGPGNPAVAAQGIGWVQELVSRLTQTRITEFASTVNGSIVGNNVTFPLSQPIFVDATHDTIISAITVAMNFTTLVATGPLPATHIPPNRSYIVNQIAPFAANLVGQVLTCPSSSKSTSITSTAPTHIRWLLNDAVVPLTGIAGCTNSKDGLCAFDTFVKGMQQRIAEVDFEFGCFGNYTVPIPDLIVDGQLPADLRTKRA
ncbi:phosphoglycerate mutase-like protein [Mycena olivaceomarginata]|nr:phosphoglycerate mutase-like protein [Mycena olivaceomarginata]